MSKKLSRLYFDGGVKPGDWIIATATGEDIPTRFRQVKEVKGKRFYLEPPAGPVDAADKTTFILDTYVWFVADTVEDAITVTDSFKKVVERRDLEIKAAKDAAIEARDAYALTVSFPEKP